MSLTSHVSTESTPSPFVVRQRETKKHEEALLSNVGKNPLVNFFWGGLTSAPAASGGGAAGAEKAASAEAAEGAVAATGMSSPSKNPSVAIARSSGPSSANSDDSETEEDDDDLSMSEDFDWLLVDGDNDARLGNGPEEPIARYAELFPGCEQVVGFALQPPSEADVAIFGRYCDNSRRFEPARPYTDKLGSKTIFPYISESKRDDFVSADIKERADDGFVFRSPSCADMELFKSYGKLNNPAHFETRVRNAYDEFARLSENFTNQAAIQ